MAIAATSDRKYLTQYQKNGVELQLLCEKAEQCERNILHKHFSRDPATFFEQLNMSRTKINWTIYTEKVF